VHVQEMTPLKGRQIVVVNAVELAS
jgi:hypothetical protein